MGLKLNLVIDTIMFILLLFTAFANREIHKITGVLLIGFIVLHIILHWKMIICMIQNFFKKKDC